MHQQENHVYDERKDHKNSKRITKTRKIMIPHQQHDGSTQCVRQRHHGSTRCARQRQQSALCTALLPTTPHFMHAQSINAGADALLNTPYNDGQGKHNSLNATAARHGSHPLTDAFTKFCIRACTRLRALCVYQHTHLLLAPSSGSLVAVGPQDHRSIGIPAILGT